MTIRFEGDFLEVIQFLNALEDKTKKQERCFDIPDNLLAVICQRTRKEILKFVRNGNDDLPEVNVEITYNLNTEIAHYVCNVVQKITNAEEWLREWPEECDNV